MAFRSVFIILFFFCNTVFSQYGWYQQNSGTNVNLNKICSNSYGTSANTFWICGNNGSILKSTNYGINWISQISGTTNNLSSIYFADTLLGLAVGNNGTIVKTTNGGMNWFSITGITTYTLNDIIVYPNWAPSNVYNCWIVGNNGLILYSSNSGSNWIQQSSLTSTNLNGLAICDPDNLFIASDNGYVLTTSDAGSSWHLYNTGFNTNLKSIWGFYQQIISTGNNGYVLSSTNSGLSWHLINVGTTQNLNSCAISVDYFYHIAGNSGVLLKSTNNGSNWFSQNSYTNINFNDIFFSNLNTGWVVGDSGTVLHTYSDYYVIDFNRFNVNEINSGYKNNGEFNCDSINSMQAGFEWPIGSNKHARFVSGLWIGATIGQDTIVSTTINGYGLQDFLPGYTDGSGFPRGSDNPDYRIYKLAYGVNDSNRIKWPNALLGNSNQGAPVYYDNSSNSWKPLDFGVQTMFYRYTDSYAYKHSNPSSLLKADIIQLNYVFNQVDLYKNVLIHEVTIINKNTVPWNNLYISMYADDDLGDASDDVTGCDTTLQMGFTYNGTNYDAIYGSAPPAVSFNLLKGPSIYTGNDNDTVFICNGKTKIFKTGYKQLGMKVFNNYQYGMDPTNHTEYYRYMVGLDIMGNQYINPYTQQPTTYLYSGDPETHTGWIQQNLDDQRFLISVGPLIMNPGDTQVIVFAQVIARGTNYLNSVTKLKQYAQTIREDYNNCFSNIPISVNKNSEIVNKFSLEQNYPNPFNPVTRITYSIPNSGKVKLIVYDVLGRKVTDLVDGYVAAGRHSIEFNASNYASGVYFYNLIFDNQTSGQLSVTRKMILIK